MEDVMRWAVHIVV